MNSMESIFHKKQNINPNAVAATVIATAAAAATSVPTNDETLQKLFDIVMPPLVVSTNFDLNNTEDVAELSLMMHQHLNEASSSTQRDFNSLNRKQPDIEANEHIMRTCLGYLDYINKKHTRERQIKVIRNKISGVVLLTLVFCMVFGLSIIMSIYLVKSLTGIMKVRSDSSKIIMMDRDFGLSVNETFFYGNQKSINSTTELDLLVFKKDLT
jgi:Fe2+ transport system protein B